MRPSMNLYTDDHPVTTIKGLGYKNATVAQQTIRRVEHAFATLRRKQLVPGWTPRTVRPHVYLRTKKATSRYYNHQMTYRILGMRNRAKGMLHRVRDASDLQAAIAVFDKWLRRHCKRQ